MTDEIEKYWVEQSLEHNIHVLHVPHFKSKEQIDKFIKTIKAMDNLFEMEVQDND